jgi:predicted DNA-binding transcriptional regulator AlpA
LEYHDLKGSIMNENPRDPEKDLLGIDQVSKLLDVPVATLRYWRHLGKGPKSFKVGRRIRYWRQDVLEWLNSEIEGDPHAA